MLSSIDTTCHSDVLTKDGMFGFCVMSSSALIAFAALTEIEYSSDFRSFIKSVIVFLKFFGVEWFVAIWFSVCIALSNASLFSSLS